ncbi:hypothetical protein SDC9_164540 [bioreactor metagenome]|uniref:Uncharacterized protein n=1 Tax=bioreactor metagenome TaxID=1076179 RepID=A0A645FTE5_9ZZZZ
MEGYGKVAGFQQLHRSGNIAYIAIQRLRYATNAVRQLPKLIFCVVLNVYLQGAPRHLRGHRFKFINGNGNASYDKHTQHDGQRRAYHRDGNLGHHGHTLHISHSCDCFIAHLSSRFQHSIKMLGGFICYRHICCLIVAYSSDNFTFLC